MPNNPVDLEQREGRVHRFKNHAVRLNIADCYKHALQDSSRAPDDPWEFMFENARIDADGGPGLIPYWIFEGPYKVERRVPMLPFSKEVDRLQRLKRSLVVYRLAFGQPRQEDLLEHFAQLKIDLAMLPDLQIFLLPKQVDDSSDAQA